MSKELEKSTDIEKKKALDLAISYLEKHFGKGTIMRLGQVSNMQIEVVPTGSLGIDLAIGVGGLPKGRIIEIYGPESSGKTTLALSVLASCQKAGGSVAFIDAEHALDIGYAKKLGLNIDDLLIAQPDYGEQALEIVDTLVRSGGIDIVVIDSVAALVPKQELEGDMDQVTVGLQARLMSKALRKMAGSISKNCIVIFINQIRMKIGGYGNPETTTGGNALKFYSSVRIEIRKGKAIIKGEEAIGSETMVKIVKNKVAPPFKKVELEIIFGHGINKEGEIISLAEKLGIMEKAGSWYSYDGNRIGQGKENVKQYLLDNVEIRNEIEAKVRQLIKTAGSGNDSNPKTTKSQKATKSTDSKTPSKG
ncbi:MAG: recombinase RecA [Alphaproteobacteria bacterium]|nr:recombinase RecA [Rickettsiales bacterium]